jgi:hypothetical protein
LKTAIVAFIHLQPPGNSWSSCSTTRMEPRAAAASLLYPRTSCRLLLTTGTTMPLVSYASSAQAAAHQRRLGRVGSVLGLDLVAW